MPRHPPNALLLLQQSPPCTGTTNPATTSKTRQPQPSHRPSHKARLHSTHALTNAPEPCNSRNASPASHPNREQPTGTGQTPTPPPSRTTPRPPATRPKPRHNQTPSRPACPGAHQNLIHSCQRPKHPARQSKNPAQRQWPQPKRTDLTAQAALAHAPTPHFYDKPQHITTRASQPAGHPTGRPPHWRWTGSNRRPPACKAGALPAELRPPGARHQKPGTKSQAPGTGRSHTIPGLAPDHWRLMPGA